MEIITPYDMNEFDDKINTLYSILSLEKNSLKKIETAAKFFLDLPYLFEPLGEGADAPYYQEPLYRTDKFDCVTFVDTILALINSHDLSQFKKNILRIRYLKNEINYTGSNSDQYQFLALELECRLHVFHFVIM